MWLWWMRRGSPIREAMTLKLPPLRHVARLRKIAGLLVLISDGSLVSFVCQLVENIYLQWDWGMFLIGLCPALTS